MDDDQKSDTKKDLTSIFDLPKTEDIALEGSGTEGDEPIIEQIEPPTPFEEVVFDAPSDEPSVGVIEISSAGISTGGEDSIPGIDPDAPFAPMEEPELPSMEMSEPPPMVERPQPKPKEDFHETKEFSERMVPGAPPVEAAFPFSLTITGKLKATDREKLLDLIQKEKMGFREVELETQLEEGRILLPRISEYAAIIIVQALRDSGAAMRLGPSDSIFSTEDTKASPDDLVYKMGESEPKFTAHLSDYNDQPFFITSGTWPHADRPYEIVETFTASVSLSTRAIEAEQSAEYQDAADALKRQLRLQAQIKGANALIHFHLSLVPLAMSTRYKLMAVATAIKSEGAFPPYMAPPPENSF